MEPITAPGIHDAPNDSIIAADNTRLQALLRTRTNAIRYHLLADVLYAVAGAVAGIPVLGPAVSAQLSIWADDLEQKAIDALNDAATAQGAANYANIQLTLLAGGVLASDVVGGVSVSDQFEGASANTHGSAWTRVSDGPGGGNQGTNGAGKSVWKKFGGLWRRHIDRHQTPLATDYQVVFVLLAKPPEPPSLGSDAYTYLLARMNSAADTFVYLRIGNNDLQLGKRNAGTWTAWKTITTDDDDNPIVVRAGDQFAFTVGTAADDREVVVRQNGYLRTTHTDTGSSAMGSDYRYVGMAAQAAERNLLLDQTRPAELELWTAADRLPAA